MFIRLNTISIFAHHGVYDDEIKNGSQFEIDLEIELPDSLGTTTDLLADTLDYSQLHKIVVGISENRRYNLLEAFANDIINKIVGDFPILKSVVIRVRKMKPPIGGEVKFVEIELRKNA